MNSSSNSSEAASSSSIDMSFYSEPNTSASEASASFGKNNSVSESIPAFKSMTADEIMNLMHQYIKDIGFIVEEVKHFFNKISEITDKLYFIRYFFHRYR